MEQTVAAGEAQLESVYLTNLRRIRSHGVPVIPCSDPHAVCSHHDRVHCIVMLHQRGEPLIDIIDHTMALRINPQL